MHSAFFQTDERAPLRCLAVLQSIMSRQLVCLALLALMGVAAAALPKYSCTGKIDVDGKKLAYVEVRSTPVAAARSPGLPGWRGSFTMD